jgi:hypothetical protein
VLKRRPCVLTGFPEDWSFSDWTLDEIAEHAGGKTVRVEVLYKRQKKFVRSCTQETNLFAPTPQHRAGEGGKFGLGLKRSMPVRAFVDAMHARDPTLYLTTQTVKTSASGKPALMAAPVSQLALRNRFPLRPLLLAGLVPAAYNLWVGCSADGSTSGLHHDFHDNLYALLKGRKQFRLFSPADTHRMYTSEEVHCVHPNGLISYAPGIRADGADEEYASLDAAVASAAVSTIHNNKTKKPHRTIHCPCV